MKGRVTVCGADLAGVRHLMRSRLKEAVLGVLLLNVCAAGAVGQTISGALPIDFGVVPVGTGRVITALTLSPAADRVVDSVTVIGANSGDFAVDAGSCTAGSTVTAGSSCAVIINFTPTAAFCRLGLLSVVSHDAATNQSFTDAVALIGVGEVVPLAGTIPLELPLTAVLQGSPIVTGIPGTPLSEVTARPTVLASRGGFNQVNVEGDRITANAGAPIRSVQVIGMTFTGQESFPLGLDTLDLCSAGTVVTGQPGFPIIEEIWYVASGTGRFFGATGSGRIVHSFDEGGTEITNVSGTITVRIPTGPFAFIYLADLLRSY